MVEKYPVFDEKLSFPEDEAAFEAVMNAIRAVRARRAEMNVPPSKKPRLIIVTDKTDNFRSGEVYLGRLAYAGELEITDKLPENTVCYLPEDFIRLRISAADMAGLMVSVVSMAMEPAARPAKAVSCRSIPSR